MIAIRSPLIISFAAVVVFTCSGCIHYAAEPIDPARRAVALTNRKLASRKWTLASLTTEALQNSANIALARAQYVTARAVMRTAGERPNPTIAFSPQIVTPYTAWIAGTYGVAFDWTVETAGKRSRRIAIASHQANAAAAHVIEAEWKVRAAVRKALLDLSATERRTALLAEANAKQAEVLRHIDERIKAGAASLLESAQPRLLAAQLRLQVSDASRGTVLARVALAEALTMGTSGLDGASFSFAAFEDVHGRRTSHRREALTRRADILAALADYAAAEATLRLEIAKQYPDVHLNPGYQLDTGENKWALGVGLALPILNQNRGLIHEAEAKRKEAAVRFDANCGNVLAVLQTPLASEQAPRREE